MGKIIANAPAAAYPEGDAGTGDGSIVTVSGSGAAPSTPRNRPPPSAIDLGDLLADVKDLGG